MGWKLFMCFVEAVRIIRPRFFLYENVASMPSNIKAYISEEFGCEPILINSALVSAQQRKRLYWTNIPSITQPEDKGILLKDIIDSGMPYQDKSHCVTARYGNVDFWDTMKRNNGSMVAEPITLTDKAHAILSTMYKETPLSMVMRGKKGLYVASPVGAALRTRTDEHGSFKRLEVRDDGKINALTTAQTDSVVCTPVRIGEIGKGSQAERIYSVHGKTVCISANGGGGGAKTGLYKIDLPDGDYTVRKLTPVEAERCQTLPDNYTAIGTDGSGKTTNISNTQRYKCIGNGWTVDVIAHILRHI
jgi:DNA (cytosine-5)-methyltransferase 3A